MPELYSHQKAAHAALREEVRRHRHADGSGEPGHAVPLLTRLSERRSSRAIMLFPLKALANDQLEKLRRLTATAGRLADSGARRREDAPPWRLKHIARLGGGVRRGHVAKRGD